MIYLSYELARSRREELLRQASDRRRATQAAAPAPVWRTTRARTPKTLRRVVRLRVFNLRVGAGESQPQTSVDRAGRRLGGGL
jgi:hypothetical protein